MGRIGADPDPHRGTIAHNDSAPCAAPIPALALRRVLATLAPYTAEGDAAMTEQIKGADDWRSETEQRKSLLRKAVVAILKTWIPDHPEAGMARGEVYPLLRDALAGYADQFTFVSLLSTGVEDIHIHDFLPHQALSMQDLLVQREGTDAFLDAKNALRVVRRKFGMMTLVARMAGVMEQRNTNAITVRQGIDEAGLIAFSKLLTARVEGTAAEEEQGFRTRMRRLGSVPVDIYFHSEMIGRRQPVAWDIKRVYTELHRGAKARMPSEPALAEFATEQMARLGARQLRQLALYASEMCEELDLGGFDPHPLFIRAADERQMLAATRSLFDEFRELRAERLHTAALGGDAHAPPDAQAHIEAAAEEGFLVDGHAHDDDEFLRIAQALERIRAARGLDFFRRISMVSGNLNFVDAATGTGLEAVESQVADLDPTEGLKKARAITEPFYRARALAAVVPTLTGAGRADDARDAATEALEAARRCTGEEAVTAFAAAVNAALGANAPEVASAAVGEALGRAHAARDPEERAAALMRVVSTLMEAGPLPPTVRSSMSAAILGPDVHFWDKKAVRSPLVEAILALMSGLDDDTIIFLQKVVSHPDVDVRQSVLRTLPFAESKPLRDMLVAHLKDPEPAVRCEVIERIGTSGDRTLASYLITHFRHGAAQGFDEKRALALALARLDPERFRPMFNAMLGPLAAKDERLIAQQKPLKEDGEWQLAGLEVLYHLNDREARRLLFNAATKGRGGRRDDAERLWAVVKSIPYGDAALPRSRHDPEWSEADEFDLLAMLDRADAAADAAVDLPEGEAGASEAAAAAAAETEATAEAPRGLFGRLRRLFNRPTAPSEVPGDAAGREDAGAAPGADGKSSGMPHGMASADGRAHGITSADGRTPDMAPGMASPDANPPAITLLERPLPPPDGPPGALLRFTAHLGTDTAGELPMVFSIYRSPDAPRPLWREARPVKVQAGRFEVLLGATDDARLPALPETVWLGLEVAGTPLGRARLARRRRVVQG